MHGLLTVLGQIDNGKAAVAERNTDIGINPSAVGIRAITCCISSLPALVRSTTPLNPHM